MKFVKWSLVILFILGLIVVLLKVGFFKKVLGPWADWAKFIGYFN